MYGLDRVRGVETDRAAWPDRSAFAQQHVQTLWLAIVIAATMAGACAAVQPPAVWLVCAAVGGLGVAHRRLKTRPAFKIAYLTLAWWAVVVGLPAVRADASLSPERLAIAGGATAAALIANLVGSNATSERPSLRRFALLAAVAGVGIALTGGPGVRSLACVPAAQGLALWPAVASERERLWRIDGSLAAGAVIALLAACCR